METLFRGVLKKENPDEPNKWVYGGIYSKRLESGPFSYIITYNPADKYHPFKHEDDMEYTHIFSEDIVESENGSRYVVRKKGALYYLVPVNGDDNVALLLTDKNGDKIKVVGNAYDNKELIERRISL